MSYSFSVAEPTKALAKAKITAAMASVMNTQPVHCKEGPAVVAFAHAMVDAMEDGKQGYNVSMSGSVSVGDWSDPAASLTYGNLSITATTAG